MSERNASNARQFLELAAFGRVDEAFDRFVAAGFTHHNPWFPGDVESLKAGIREAAQQAPTRLFEVQRAIAQGDVVAVHSKTEMEGHPRMAVVHILRFDDTGKIVEMWDVCQPQPDDVVNERGMF
jgi:predicted SnoaL-like aldol condensation-catalyzing enzyme